MNGVKLIDPNSTLNYDTKFGKDVIIHPNVVFGKNVIIGSFVEIKSFSHIEECKIKRINNWTLCKNQRWNCCR